VSNSIASVSFASFSSVSFLHQLAALTHGIAAALDIADATAILIEGSIIESVGIPIFLAMGCQGVTITSSYFEGNHNPAYFQAPKILHPVYPDIGAPPIVVNADIVINGATRCVLLIDIGAPFHSILFIDIVRSTGREGNSDYKNWPSFKDAVWHYGASYPCHSIRIGANYHASAANSSAILAIAVDGLDVDGIYASTSSGEFSVIETGTIPALFAVRNVHMRASSQYCASSSCPHPGDIGVKAAASLVSLVEMPWASVAPDDSPTRLNPSNLSGLATTIPFHTWNNEDSPSLYAPRNLLHQYFGSKQGGTESVPWSTDCTVQAKPPGFNEIEVASFEPKAAKKKCTVTMRTLQLPSAPARGKPIYVFMQAQLSASASVALWIDPGVSANGTSVGEQSSALLTSEDPEPTEDGWQALTFHGTLGVSGEASFGFTVVGGQAAVAGVVAAPIGQEWSRFLAG
jgi:hypothetical protein